MKCPNCGQVVNENESFCGNCGNVVKKENYINGNINDNKIVQNINKNEVSSNKQPKKNNTSKILIVISILLLIVLLIFVIMYFINRDKDLKYDNDNQNTEEKDNKNNNSNKENNKTDNSNNEDKKDDVAKNFNYVLSSSMKAIKDYYEPITTTKTEVEKIVFEINSDKKLIMSCSDNSCDKQIIDLNGESAKYVGSTQSGYANLYYVVIFTEQGNLYELFFDVTKLDMQPRKTLENLVGFTLIPFGYKIDLMSALTNSPGGKGPKILGLTSDNKYVEKDSSISLDKSNLILTKSHFYDSSLHKFKNVFIHEDGKLLYISGEEYKNCTEQNAKNNKNDVIDSNIINKCTNQVINNLPLIVDEKSNTIYARLGFFDENGNYYIISLDNNIYQLTNDKSGENYIAKKYNNSPIKEIKDISMSDVDRGWFSSITVVYNNNSEETFKTDGNGIYSSQIIFEEK